MGTGSTVVNGVLDAIYNQTAYSVATIYGSLHTGDPGTTGASEATGANYARVNVSAKFGAASGSVSNNAAITWDDPGAATYSYVGLYDSLTGGNFLRSLRIKDSGGSDSSVTAAAGDQVTIASGNLTDDLT